MCGRYAQYLRPSQVRRYLESDYNMPVDDAPDDESADSSRQTYNFAPSYRGLVYRADVPGPEEDESQRNCGGSEVEGKGHHKQARSCDMKYKLQAMNWGLIPFWTKRSPNFSSIMRAINCRDDSLSMSGGMWSAIKAKKRCIVIAEGFYEWIKAGPKEKVPYYVKRKDERLMCFAGLWDCVRYQDSKETVYTFTIITTDSNSQLQFLHDRMPVILEPGSADIWTWLNPSRNEWSKELQSLLRPSETLLQAYPVSKEVGKVGNNSASFVIPVDSVENKSNIANFFNATAKKGRKSDELDESGTTGWRDQKNLSQIDKDLYMDDLIENQDRRAGQEQADSNLRPQKKAKISTKLKSEDSTIHPARNKHRDLQETRTSREQKITKFFSGAGKNQ